MRKRILSVLLIASLLVTLCLPVWAAVSAYRVRAELSFSQNEVECFVKIMESGSINATLELWCLGVKIASWSGKGTDYLTLSGSHTAVRGQTYTLTVSGTINGESIDCIPVSKTYS